MSSDQPFEPAPPTPPAGPAAGWYSDPGDPAMQRYWDGTAWSTQTAPLAAQSWPAAPGAQGAPMYGAPGYGSTAYGPGWGVAPRKVGFGEAIRRAFRGWSDYSGRATVGEFWWFYLFSVIVFAVPYVLLLVLSVALLPGSATSSSTQPLTPREEANPAAIGAFLVLGAVFLVLALGLFLVQLALTVRRLHDSDREGWWYLISFVPFGSLVLLYFLVQPGTPGPNRYGPVPT
ncbi:MAG: DUF805 domain-containing protein [Candidatus Nanopelagicales bacterium]